MQKNLLNVDFKNAHVHACEQRRFYIKARIGIERFVPKRNNYTVMTEAQWNRVIANRFGWSPRAAGGTGNVTAVILEC